MKIAGLKYSPIVTFLTGLAAFNGLIAWATYCLTDMPVFHVPVGLVTPFLYANVNLNLGRSTDPLTNFLYLCVGVFAYALDGLIASSAFVWIFNAVAENRGGLSLSFIIWKPSPAASAAADSNS